LNMEQVTSDPFLRKLSWPGLLPFLGLIAALQLLVACDQKSTTSGLSPNQEAGLLSDAGDAGRFGQSDADGTGLNPSACEPAGDFRCSPEQPAVLEVCDPGTVVGWTEYLRCGAPELCDADRGGCLACEPGAIRCDGWRLQRCDATGSHWQLQAECMTEDHCTSTEARCLT